MTPLSWQYEYINGSRHPHQMLSSSALTVGQRVEVIHWLRRSFGLEWLPTEYGVWSWNPVQPLPIGFERIDNVVLFKLRFGSVE